MSKIYVLSPNAQKSLRGIKAYSIDKFGERQAKIYLEKIRESLRSLATNPEQGKNRDKLLAGFYSSPVGSHMIYYKIQPHQIDVIDILYQKMEPLLHLYEDLE